MLLDGVYFVLWEVAKLEIDLLDRRENEVVEHVGFVELWTVRGEVARTVADLDEEMSERRRRRAQVRIGDVKGERFGFRTDVDQR